MTDRLTVKDDGFATMFPLPHPSFPFPWVESPSAENYQEEMDGTSTMTLRFPFAVFSPFQGGTNLLFGISTTVIPLHRYTSVAVSVTTRHNDHWHNGFPKSIGQMYAKLCQEITPKKKKAKF